MATDSAEPKPAPTHFDNVSLHLARLEARFVEFASNPHAPAEDIGAMLQTLHLLRTEVALIRSRS